MKATDSHLGAWPNREICKCKFMRLYYSRQVLQAQILTVALLRYA